MCVVVLACLENVWLYKLSYLAFTISPCLFLDVYLSLKVKGCDIDVPFRAEHSSVSYFLNIDQLWVSILTAIYHKKKFSDEDWQMH